MIRGSLIVAAIAVVLSMILHGLGLNMTVGQVTQEAPDSGGDAPAEFGESFADIAEPAPEPEPPEVTVPDEVQAEVPTTEALVASETPQNVTTPDTGTAQVVTPNAPEDSEASAPPLETIEATEPQIPPEQNLAALEPVEPETTAEIIEPAPEETPETVEAAPEELPEPELPNTPQITVEASPEVPEIDAEIADETVLEAAVTRSLRPPEVRPSTEALTSQQRSAPEPSETGTQAVVGQVTGLELLALQGLSTPSGTGAFSGARAAGNADASNYAGRVLVQLNRSKVLYAAEEGTARVQFQIAADGSVAWVRILSSSGSIGIAKAASAQVRSAAPFPRPPKGTTPRMVFVYRNN